MAKPGRRSAAELALDDVLMVGVGRRMPPPPPSELSDAQSQIWRDAVSSMPGNWLQRGAYAILVEYCRRVCRARLLEQQIAAFEMEWLGAPGGVERLDRLLMMGDRETKSALACARALRLTPQALQHPRSAARAVANMTPHPSPWGGAEEP